MLWATQIACGANFCGAITTGGNVVCWGHNNWSQCDVPTDLGAVSQLALGWTYAFTISPSGQARYWGQSTYSGQANVPAWIGPMSKIDCGSQMNLAIRSAGPGALACWGGTSGNCICGCNEPTASPFRAVAVGYNFAAAIDATGAVKCWGSNSQGQLNIPANLGTCTGIDAGDWHAVALRTDGQVRCWGSNLYLQSITPSNLGACSQVAAGRFHTLALRTDGTVRCWGKNTSGECNVPKGLTKVVQIAAGDSHSVALTTVPDTDGDGWNDLSDNCPAISNPGQQDCDADGIGDACANGPDCNGNLIPDVCEVAGGSGDCDRNGIPDDCDIINGQPDINLNGIPDRCECLGDILADGRIDGADLGAMLSYWGPATSSQISMACDIDKNGVVNGADLGLLLSNWGRCPN